MHVSQRGLKGGEKSGTARWPWGSLRAGASCCVTQSSLFGASDPRLLCGSKLFVAMAPKVRNPAAIAVPDDSVNSKLWAQHTENLQKVLGHPLWSTALTDTPLKLGAVAAACKARGS